MLCALEGVQKMNEAKLAQTFPGWMVEHWHARTKALTMRQQTTEKSYLLNGLA